MKTIILILLTSFSILNSQSLVLMEKGKLVELNPNPYFSNWSYTDLLSGWNLTSGWTSSQATINDNNTFTTTSSNNGGPYKTSLTVADHVYQFKFASSQTTGTTRVSQTSTSTVIISGNGTVIYKNGASAGIWIRNDVSGSIVDVNQLELRELIPPTGWTSSTMDANNYVLQGNGCKFVEATGTTYIETNSALKKGTRKFKVTQDWTQGRLSISNGTTSVNLSQADGTQIVSLYFDGTQKMKVECTNNTISVISSLSIK